MRDRFEKIGAIQVQRFLDEGNVSEPLRELALEFLSAKEEEAKGSPPTPRDAQTSHILMAAERAIELAELHGETARRALFVAKTAIAIAIVALIVASAALLHLLD